MIICEFCVQYDPVAVKCGFGLNLPKHMRCREFEPGLDKFFAEKSDFVRSSHIIQMANFFGISGMELKKVKALASQEEALRANPPAPVSDPPAFES